MTESTDESTDDRTADPTPTADWMTEALALHRRGDLPRAEQLYRKVLSHEPHHADALHFLGVLAAQAGHPQPALELIDRAIAIDPTAAHFRVNRGNVLRGLGRVEEAIDSYHGALELSPRDVSAYVNLANTMRQAERMEEALEAARSAAQLQEDEAELQNLMGVILADLGRTAEAIEAFEAALVLRPDFPDARANLEHARFEAEWKEEIFVASAQVDPTAADEKARLDLELPAEAAESPPATAETAEAIEPPVFEPVVQELEVFEPPAPSPLADEAVVEEALELEGVEEPIEPGDLVEADEGESAQVQAAIDFGEVRETSDAVEGVEPDPLHEPMELHEEAEEVETVEPMQFNEPVELRAPAEEAERAEAHIDLVEIAAAPQGADVVKDAIATWRPAAIPPPPEPRPAPADERALSAATHSQRLAALHARHDDPAEIFDEHRWWNDLHAAALERDALPHFVDMSPQRRLRIGYVSAELRHSAVARFLLPVLKCRDRERFEAVVFHSGSAEGEAADEMLASLRGQVDAWHDVAGLSDEALAAMIRAKGVDILVDLSGHSPGNRLLALARKPAPVQVTWLGYPETTGMTAIDYRLTDTVADPPGHPSGAFSSETLLRLDDSFICLQLDEAAQAPIERIRRRRVVFGVLGDFAKASPEVMALWGRILTSSPGARLLLAGRGLEQSAAAVEARSELRRHGVASDRIELLGEASGQSEHLARFNRIDVALDTYPFSSITTTCDALSMGVPVATLAGATHASRRSASLLAAAGLGNLAASQPQEYISLAIELARGGVRSADQRRELCDAVAASPLCDEQRFTKKLEEAFRRIWRQFCER